MECSERVENIINRKITIFYIKAIPQNVSQLQQKICFRARSKNNFDFFRAFWVLVMAWLLKPQWVKLNSPRTFEAWIYHIEKKPEVKKESAPDTKKDIKAKEKK